MSVDRVFPQAMRRLMRTADKLGIALPAEIRQEVIDDMALIDKADSFDFAAGPSMSEVVLAAIREDRDPLSDPEVIRAVTRESINEKTNFGTITQAATDRLYTTVIGHLDAIIDVFKPAFDKAGATLTEAHAVITGAGFRDLNDAGLMNAAMPVAKANVNAREALALIADIQGALALILTCTGSNNPSPIGKAVQIADLGDATMWDVARARLTAPWDLVANGYTLSLANPTEAEARAAHARQMQDDAERAAADNRQRAIRNTIGMGANA